MTLAFEISRFPRFFTSSPTNKVRQRRIFFLNLLAFPSKRTTTTIINKIRIFSTYRAPPVAHPYVALYVESWGPGEAEGLHVGVDHGLVHGAVHAPSALMN